jgi:hypothetical protein
MCDHKSNSMKSIFNSQWYMFPTVVQWYDGSIKAENFKSDLELEKYLLCVTHIGHKRSLAKFRCSSHNLAIESQLGVVVNREDRICCYCLNLNDIHVIEDEYHFLLICPLYNHNRHQYLHAYYYANLNMHSDHN